MVRFAYEFPKEIQQALIRCYTHLGGHRITKAFHPYVYEQRKDDKITIIDIAKQWEKFVFAARVITAYPPEDVLVLSARPYGFKAVARFCEFTGCVPKTGRFVPGTFTNLYARRTVPKLIVVADPFSDAQAVKEASYMGIPCVAFCNTDTSFSFVDVAVPCNNRSLKAIGASFCVLAKLIQQMRGVGRMADNLENDIERFFFRDPVELEKLAAEQEADADNEGLEHVENDEQEAEATPSSE